jgi:hypothetical protein
MARDRDIDFPRPDVGPRRRWAAAPGATGPMTCASFVVRGIGSPGKGIESLPHDPSCAGESNLLLNGIGSEAASPLP